MKKSLSKPAPYPDKKNSPHDNAGQTVGVIVLILFIGAFLYLLITGIPTIGVVFQLFVETIVRLFTLQD